MKYENRKIANSLCDQIDALKAKLEMLNPPLYLPLTVEIVAKEATIKIFVDKDSRREDFAPFAATMIESIKQNISERISNLTSQLEQL